MVTIDLQKTIELLKQKSKEAIYVASLPYNNNEFIPWRRNIEDILESAFGVTSTEYKRVADFHVTIQGKREAIQRDYKIAVHRIHQEVNTIIQKYEILGLGSDNGTSNISPSDSLKCSDGRTIWKDIKTEFGVTKRSFGKKINFVKDSFKRNLIYRDVEQAFILSRLGYSKPAVILAGGVIEELLRLYLKKKGISPQKPLKKDFNGFIITCEREGFLKDGISRLSDSARHFRNVVHLKKEETKRYTISMSAAKGAIASIFTIANDF